MIGIKKDIHVGLTVNNVLDYIQHEDPISKLRSIFSYVNFNVSIYLIIYRSVLGMAIYICH